MTQGNAFKRPGKEEILEILELLNESDFDELRLEMKGLRLIVSKRALEPEDESLQPAAQPQLERDASQGVQTSGQRRALEPEAEVSPGLQGVPTALEEREAVAAGKPGLIPVKSPLLGVFYRSPKPGAPPFVEAGSYVTEEDTVCLIEVMKLFNTVKAGARGRIAEVCAENGQMVEYGQVLFLIDPEKEGQES